MSTLWGFFFSVKGYFSCSCLWLLCKTLLDIHTYVFFRCIHLIAWVIMVNIINCDYGFLWSMLILLFSGSKYKIFCFLMVKMKNKITWLTVRGFFLPVAIQKVIKHWDPPASFGSWLLIIWDTNWEHILAGID